MSDDAIELLDALGILKAQEPMRKKIAAEIERLREQLAKARETLKDFIDIVDRAQSGFISGSRSDLDWEKGRDDRVRAARLLLTDDLRSEK